MRAGRGEEEEGGERGHYIASFEFVIVTEFHCLIDCYIVAYCFISFQLLMVALQ